LKNIYIVPLIFVIVCAISAYHNELTIRIAEEKCPAKGAYKNTRRDDDTIIKNNKSNGKLRTIIFLFGLKKSEWLVGPKVVREHC
jgi:hypothetical protein